MDSRGGVYKVLARSENEGSEDNDGATGFIKTGKFSKLSKQMAVRYHRIVDLVETYGWKVVYCHTLKMIADLLTKNLAEPGFEKLVPMLMGWSSRVHLSDLAARVKLRNDRLKKCKKL